MIQGILDILFNILASMIEIFPKIEFLDRFSEVLSGIVNILEDGSVFIPFNDIFICLSLASGFYISLFVIKCVNWVIHRIPFIN